MPRFSFSDARTWMRSHMDWAHASLFLLIEWAACFFFLLKARIVPEGGFLLDAESMLATGPIPNIDAYPPLLRMIYWGAMKTFHVSSLNPWIVYTLGFFLAGGAFYWLLTQLNLSAKTQKWIFLLGMLNPYFVWLTLTSKDTAFEAFFSFLFFGLVFKRVHTQEDAPVRTRSVILLVAVALLGLLTRLTTIFPALLVCVMLAIFLRGTRRKEFVTVSVGVLLIALGYAGIHARAYGSFSLSNTFAPNFYFGNHPLYDYAHPRNDLDIFLPNSLDESVFQGPDSSKKLISLGVERIIHQPSAFAVRIIEKSLWHWFNFEKIPNLSSNTMVLSATNDQLVLRVTPIRYFEMLPYLLYKLLYVPAFFFALLALAALRDRKLFSFTLLLVPLLALWPIVVLTFPDTRFKIVGEMMAVPFIWIACDRLIARICSSQT